MLSNYIFFKFEQLYVQELTSIPCSESISFDHTFKVAANIGFLRKNGKCIHQYDSLFIFMIERGLKERPSTNIVRVYIDDCCKLSKKIQSVLGSNVAVKLDIFYATQGITRT